MFLISLSPQVREGGALTLQKQGDSLIVGGVEYDFSRLPEGGTLPVEACGCEYIVGDISRVNGNIEATLLLPITADASDLAKFPAPLEITEDGEVVLPC